ncbi:MAG: nucleoside-diphosphate sugar epimerase/dehydratase [Thermodesulfobacteriota bacterium]
MNSYSQPSLSGFIFAFIEGLLIIVAIFLGNFLRLGWEWKGSFSEAEFLTWKIMLAVLIMQVSFYYFDLYEFRNFKERTKTAVFLLESLAVSSIVLAVIYYILPDLAFGRGVFVISIFLVFLFSLMWRIFYPRIFGNYIFKEKVLIVGTGELAQKIQKEIEKNGQSLYEIVGFVGENGRKVEERLFSGDYWGFQPDFFHLPEKTDR